MKERDRHYEEQLERLFEASRASLPAIEPDPGLPAQIRAMAEDRAAVRPPAARRSRPRWAFVSLAGAALALSIMAGGYVGYRAWAATQDTSTDVTRDADTFMAAWSQSGFADDLSGIGSGSGEVQE
jgi:hypothetical protein